MAPIPRWSRLVVARAAAIVAAVIVAASGAGPQAQGRLWANREGSAADRGLDRTLPDVATRLVAIERAQAAALGALARGGPIDEPSLVQRLVARIDRPAPAAQSDTEADRAYAQLGSRTATVLRRGHAFYRDVLAVYADVPPSGRRQAIDAALVRYRGDPGHALPSAAKDLTILYDHPFTSFEPPRPGETEPRRNLPYPRLTGTIWAMHWYELAVQEALEPTDPVARTRALALVAERFGRKLTGTVAPDAPPSELPLAPSIAPGLVALHEGAAAVVDNRNMLVDVIAETLVRATGPARQAGVARAVSEFLRRDFRCVQVDEWVTTALRHSIFEQGGPALGTMKGNERNSFFGAHAQHFGPKRALPPCDPE